MFLISVLVPSLVVAAQAQRHVGVAAERALLHVAVADAEVAHQRPQRAHVLGRLVGGAQVRLADDLAQRHARAVVVDQARARVGVHVLARVLLQVDAGQAHRARLAVQAELDGAALAERLVELRDLKALGQIGIEVVLAREAAALADLAADRQPEAHRRVDRGAVQHRQRAGQAQADRIGRGCSARPPNAADEHEKILDLGRELDVHLEADHQARTRPGSRRRLRRQLLVPVGARARRRPRRGSSVSSPSGGPSSCRPIGSPALVKPHGCDSAGTPARSGASVRRRRGTSAADRPSLAELERRHRRGRRDDHVAPGERRLEVVGDLRRTCCALP